MNYIKNFISILKYPFFNCVYMWYCESILVCVCLLMCVSVNGGKSKTLTKLFSHNDKKLASYMGGSIGASTCF